MASFLPGFQLLTCKAAISLVILSSRLVIYLTAENRDEGRLWLGRRPAPFALFVCCARDSPTSLVLPGSLCCASTSAFSGERPRGGVQSGGQQGVPLPDKNGFFFPFSSIPAQHTSHTLLSCPFKLIWLKVRPQKHFALCSSSWATPV